MRAATTTATSAVTCRLRCKCPEGRDPSASTRPRVPCTANNWIYGFVDTVATATTTSPLAVERPNVFPAIARAAVSAYVAAPTTGRKLTTAATAAYSERGVAAAPPNDYATTATGILSATPRPAVTTTCVQRAFSAPSATRRGEPKRQ